MIFVCLSTITAKVFLTIPQPDKIFAFDEEGIASYPKDTQITDEYKKEIMSYTQKCKDMKECQGTIDIKKTFKNTKVNDKEIVSLKKNSKNKEEKKEKKGKIISPDKKDTDEENISLSENSKDTDEEIISMDEESENMEQYTREIINLNENPEDIKEKGKIIIDEDAKYIKQFIYAVNDAHVKGKIPISEIILHRRSNKRNCIKLKGFETERKLFNGLKEQKKTVENICNFSDFKMTLLVVKLREINEQREKAGSTKINFTIHKSLAGHMYELFYNEEWYTQDGKSKNIKHYVEINYDKILFRVREGENDLPEFLKDKCATRMEKGVKKIIYPCHLDFGFEKVEKIEFNLDISKQILGYMLKFYFKGDNNTVGVYETPILDYEIYNFIAFLKALSE
jgi:hypothetical protein